ncbi:MAG: right-handed parallel beta-helix repeat-containing protein, partial [Candidatus Bipolaricaulota bacterium]
MPNHRIARVCSRVILGLLLACVAAHTVFADEIRVPDDYRSLQQAVNASSAGDEIIITRRTALRENVTIRNARRLTITTARTASEVVLQARDHDEPVIELANCRQVLIENLNIQSGSVGVFCENGDDVVFSNCIIQENKTVGITGTGFELEECTVRWNLTWGVELIGDPEDPTEVHALITDSVIHRNFGGGVRIQAATVEFSSATISNNVGYGLEVLDDSVVTFDDGSTPTLIENNVDGVWVHDATITLQGIIRDNGNEGVLAEDATLHLEGAMISGHPVAGVHYVRSTGTVIDTTITENPGDGVIVDDASSVTISGGLISLQGLAGILAINAGQVVVDSGALIQANAGSGLVVRGASATVLDATILENEQHGILVDSAGTLATAGAVVNANLMDGIHVSAASATIAASDVFANAANGITALEGAEVTVLDGSTVHENGVDGIAVDSA